MKPFQFKDFQVSGAWCVARLDTQVQAAPVEIYLLLDLPSGRALAHETVADPQGATLTQVRSLFNQARNQVPQPPKRLLVSKGEPAARYFETEASRLGMVLEEIPASYLEPLLVPLKKSFGKHFPSPSSIPYVGMEEGTDADDIESARQFVPDSYDPCPCASGKKFKFCCKPGFTEIMGAMMAAENGRHHEAMGHIAAAKRILGETAEVLCREAVVQSFVDEAKMKETLTQALEVNPDHPRANYMRGIECKLQGNWDGAIQAYQKAIANYPKTDRYHLNETYNNLGTAYYETGDIAQAKSAWEQALALLPSDKRVRQNLRECIYENPELPSSLREVSPFIQRILSRR